MYVSGYEKKKKNDNSGKKSADAIKNLKKQAPLLKDIEFKCCNFLDLPKDKIKGYVIYCDIPYKGTTKYKTEPFPYEEFYIWANEMAKYNTVLVSEYNMPSNFKCIWEKDIKVNIDKNGNTIDENRKRTEKLFLCSTKND